MAQRQRRSKIDTPTARGNLPISKKPVYKSLETGVFIGYRRGKSERRWVARIYVEAEKKYVVRAIGHADDPDAPHGPQAMAYAEARDAVLAVAGQLRSNAITGPFTVADALDFYMDNFEGKSVVATRSRADSIIKPALGYIAVAKLTDDDVRDWHEQRGRSAARLRTSKTAEKANERPADTDEAIRRRRSTANRDLTVLKAALNYAVEKKRYRGATPWREVKPFKNVDAAKFRFLTDAEQQRLVNAAAPSIRPLIQAALLTAGRYSELARLQMQDYDPEAGTVLFRETKSGVDRHVYLETEGVRLFEQNTAGKKPTDLIFPRPDGDRWMPSQQARPIAAACKKANVPACGFHDLRRSYGARLARRGVPMAVIAKALGHADERITQKHYAHLSKSYLADTIREHVAGLGIVAESNLAVLGRK